MKTETCLTLILAISLTPPPAAGSGSDWPTWSGPNRDLTTPGDGVFSRRGAGDGGRRPGFGLERLWGKPLGSGYSGILVVGERLVTAFSDGESDFVVALAADSGDELWRYRIGEVYKGHDGSHDGPLATPSIHRGVVYGLGGGGELFALRLADGHEVWRRHAVDDLGAQPALYGFVSAPTVIGGVLVVETGGGGGHSITGLDPESGELLWSTGDDPVTYQSPMALSIEGEEQVLAVTDRHVLGLAPHTGEVLWQHEHKSESHFDQTQPVPVGEAGVLLQDEAGSVLFRVAKSAGGYRVEEAWRSKALSLGSAVAVPHEGYIYGFAGRSFLTCVDAASGEPVWKSRPPGRGDLVLVDGHLVIRTMSGEVVVAEATPEGYREKARCEAPGRGWTRPSFAAGRIYVRNLSDIVAIGVTDGEPAAGEPAAGEPAAGEPDGEEPDGEEAMPAGELRGEIGDLVRRVEAAADKGRVIDEFMAAHQEYPVLEGDDLVHFVFRGAVDDLTLVGNTEPWERERPMHRIDGTDFYFRSMALEPEGRFEYTFGVFDERRLDPLNPRRSILDGRQRSVVTTRGWSEATHLREPEGDRGRIEEFTWKSDIVGDERQVQVYLPAGYDESEQRYPLLLFYHGGEALEWGQLDRTLDNLTGKSVAPLIVAFLPRGESAETSSGAPQFVQALAGELLPALDRSYRTRARPEDRAMMGNHFAGWFAVHVVIQRPDLFRKAATQSPVYSNWGRAPMLELIEKSAKADHDFVIEWTDHEYRDRQGLTPGQLLEEALVKKGYAPVAHQIPGGLGWPTWRQTTGRILESLFPQAALSVAGVERRPPPESAQIFGEGLMTTARTEHVTPSFSADGSLAIWSVWTRQGQRIEQVSFEGGVASAPRVLDFGGRADGPYLSPSEDRLYFASQQGVTPGSEPRQDRDIWFVERQGGEWLAPRHLPPPVSSPESEIFPSVARSGNLYFLVLGEPKVYYRSRFENGKYLPRERLPDEINRGAHYSNIFVDPDERYLIFCSDRPGGYGDGDLYVTARRPDGTWGAARNLGPAVNSERLDRFPKLTPDGRVLLFARHTKNKGRGYGQGDFYWVDATVVETALAAAKR